MPNSDTSDIEDDPDDVVSPADKQKWFQEEVVDLMNRSLKDPAVFSCIIGELDQVRQAHSQRPAALNREVVRTMIYLPFSVNSSINRDLEVYSVTFSKLLERYDPLLRNLNKNKEAQLEGVDYVTTPFMELTRNDKLNADDWSTRKVGPVLNALKSHYIIEEVRVKEVMAVIEQEIANLRNVQHMEMEQQQEAERRSLRTLVTDAEAASASAAVVSMPTLMPAVVPEGNQQGPEEMEVELVGVLKPQPVQSIEDCSMDEVERHRQLPTLTSERFSGKFDHTGGTLDTYLTNDYLHIPEGAIPEGTSYSIWGSVHSALDRFGEWVNKKKGERLIAPVNEFCVEGNHHFLKPVTLVIHHAITNREHFKKVEIALKEDDGSYLEVKPAHLRKEDQPWFEINEECITIHTLQLCKALCKTKSDRKINGKLRGILYGHMFLKDGKYIAEVEFYMHFCRAVQNLQGQSMNLQSWRTDSGCAYLDVQTFAISPDLLNSDDKLVVEFVLSDEDADKWALRNDSDNKKEEEIKLKSVMSCLDQFDDPLIATKYAFSNTTSSVKFPLMAKLKAKIVHEPPNGSHGISLGIKIPREFGRQFEEGAQAPPSTSKLELTDKKLNVIAKEILPENLIDLALELNIGFTEVQQIIADNSNNSRVQNLKVLHTWYTRLPSPTTNAVDQLEKALRSTNNGNAANVLISMVNAETGVSHS